jgi:signal transduction histidine kinase
MAHYERRHSPQAILNKVQRVIDSGKEHTERLLREAENELPDTLLREKYWIELMQRHFCDVYHRHPPTPRTATATNESLRPILPNEDQSTGR